MPPYKIALVSDWYYPRVGGVEYAINALARHLLALGHQVHIITKKIKGMPEREQQGNLLIVRLDNDSIAEFLITRKAYCALKAQLTQGDYDIVHAHSVSSPLALASLKICSRNNMSSIITNHSQIEGNVFNLPERLILNYFLKYADSMIAVSDLVYKESLRLFSGPVYCVPNGIDDISPNGALVSYPVPDGKTVITTIARMVKRKGVDDFIDMALALLKTHKNLLFILVGDGPLKTKLEKIVQRHGVSQYFLFVGMASRATALHLLEKTKIFVLASKQEAFGIAILEAFYKKIPVIARVGTGAAMLIQDRETGFLAKDMDDFTKIATQLIEDPLLCESVASAAYNELPQYDWHRIAKATESIYTKVLNITPSLRAQRSNP